MRERMLAVVQGRRPDRVPFVQYDGIAAPNSEVWEIIGRENMGILRWSSIHRFESPNCRWESVNIEIEGRPRGIEGRPGVRNTLHTPKGSLWEEKRFEPTYGTAATKKHFIQERDDYLPLIAYLEDQVVVEDYGPFLRDEKELGDDGLPHVSLMRTPYQQLWVQWVSLENLAIHLIDYPDVLADVTNLMGKRMREIFEIVRRSPIPYAVFPDNITAPPIGERYFREYCLPYYHELAEMMGDRPVYVHMDGDLKPLWSAIGESGVRGLDSYSPPPDNDTSVAEAAAIWPEMRLGVNFPSSIHLTSPEVIRETADRILAEAGHTGRLQIQISENVPPGAWRKSYPIIVEAIRDFGEL